MGKCAGVNKSVQAGVNKKPILLKFAGLGEFLILSCRVNQASLKQSTVFFLILSIGFPKLFLSCK